jgi:tagatose 6-phosphate kinase
VILVVSLNPAIDITHEVRDPAWKGVNRPHAVHVRPGGKGVNVARTLAALGTDVTLLGLAGGPSGAELAGLLAGSGISVELTPILAPTRRTFTVVDTGTGDAALFNEPGPPVSDGEYAQFLAAYRAGLAGAAVVVLSGSLPGQRPDRTYAELIAAARELSVPVILDTSGRALALGAAARPALVKPNVAELAEATGRPGPLEGTEEVSKAARELGAAVVASLGPDGVLAITEDGAWLARPGEAVRGNPTGAGDALVAGLADGFARGLGWAERLRHGVALGAASVAAPAAGEYSDVEYRRQLPLVEVEQRWG